MIDTFSRPARATTLALVALLAAATILPAQTPGSIEGTVSAAGDRPISDATVVIIGTTRGARTDDAGKFRITGVSPGAYQVRAQRIGFASATQTASVVAGQATTVSFTLKEAA